MKRKRENDMASFLKKGGGEFLNEKGSCQLINEKVKP